jgi:hypothetical protein
VEVVRRAVVYKPRVDHDHDVKVMCTDVTATIWMLVVTLAGGWASLLPDNFDALMAIKGEQTVGSDMKTRMRRMLRRG